MKLSQSAHLVPRKLSRSRLKIQQTSKELKKDSLQLQPITITIKIGKNDQLEPSFVDTFSKIIINNTNFDFQECYGDIKTTTYSEFYETLRNLGNQMSRAKICKDFNQHLINLKVQQKSGFKKTKSYENIRKGSIQIAPKAERKNYLFRFEAHRNTVILLIDLSAYMLLYDYSTKSFLLQNAQEITRDLFVELQRHYNQRKNGNSGPSYFISCYVFSVYCSEIQEVIQNEEIFFSNTEQKFKNSSLVCDYICAYLNRSKLPQIQKDQHKVISISQFIQRVLNLQEGNSGIKTIVTISAFKQIDHHPYIFFNSNWYTYCFLCAGELNFGSYLIDANQIVNRFSKSPYLQTKFVFKCRFLENWEKVRLIQQQGFQFRYLDSSVQKSRAILYISNRGQKKESIFEDILKFNLKLNDKKKKAEGTYKSNDSMPNIAKSPKLLNQHQFNIRAQNIAQIMRTKYLQGWEQIPTENYPHNTKYLFKLQFANRAGVLYNATRTQDYFNVKVSSIITEVDLQPPNEDMIKSRKQIAEKIKRIDMINTSNFEVVTAFKNKNTTQSDSKLKNDIKYKFYLNFDSDGYEGMNMLNEILNDHEEWNCYFKVRRIFVHFTPNSHFLNDFNELLNEVGFFLGERISNLCFMHRKQKKEKLMDNIKEREVSRWNIIFVKVSGIFQFLEFKFGFLKYNDNEIKQTIENIENKLVSKKLANGSIKLIPQDIYSYCIQKFDQPKVSRKCLANIFEKSWRITFKNQFLCKAFKYMHNKIIKKLGYIALRCKQTGSHYYNIINLAENQSRKEKGLFLQILYQSQCSIQFKLQAFPSFCFIQSLTAKQISHQIAGSQKNIYHMTQRSISSSSSNQNSISHTSLPFPTSIKEVTHSKSLPQRQWKCKNSFFELFEILAGELKESQKRATNLIKSYTQIYQTLIKKRIEQKKSGIQNQQLVEKIKELYRFNTGDFETEFLSTIIQIKKEHYSEENLQAQRNLSLPRRQTVRAQQVPSLSTLLMNIDQIPQPSQYLMQSPITFIKGDLTLKSKTNPQKSYKFSLLTPNLAVYLWKKEFKTSFKIYYRTMSNIYSSTSAIAKEEAGLKQFIQREMIARIDKQLKQEQYLLFYNIISKQQSEITTSVLNLKIKKEKKDTTIKGLIEKTQKVIYSFTGVSLNCSQIFSIIDKQQNVLLQQRMTKVLIQFKKKFYQYLDLFFQVCQFNFEKESEMPAQNFFSNKEKNSSKTISHENQTSDMKNPNEDSFINIVVNNNYFYEKRNPLENQEAMEKFRIRNPEQFQDFESIVAKVCTNSGVPLYQQNFVQFFVNKNRKKSSQSQKHKQTNLNRTQIQIHFFGFKTTKSSAKVRWLNQIMTELLSECVAYLNIMTVAQPNDIKQMENKLSDLIIRGPMEKVPDELWNQLQLIRQIQSGHMRNIIPFHQYSSKPLPAKFIARQVQSFPTFGNKSYNLFYLKYWLTMQITPSRVLKTKIIPFKHINLSTEAILDFTQTNYELTMIKMVEDYMAQLLKFIKIKDIFKGIEHRLMFPSDPPILLFINYPIYKKLDDQKKKSTKIKIPKKFKNRPNNYPTLEVKSTSVFLPDQTVTSTSSFLQSTTTPMGTSSLPFPFRVSSYNNEDSLNLKGYFKLSMIYQGSINYFPKFQSSQILSLLSCCEKLNPYAIRNLENTYIFFNPELKEYFIFYLQEASTPTQYVDQLIKSEISVFSSASQIQKRKNNSLLYSVYCIDGTVPKAVIEKLHGGLIKKALEEVTFYKIAKILQYSHSIIDEAEEQYFKEGERQQLVFKIPLIGRKSNLNQYLKQLLQKAFYHKKTQFKSQLKKKQNEKVELIDDEAQLKDQRKISTKRKPRKELNHSQECQMRCVPQTWIFNTVQNRQLQQMFGKCMFLTKVQINDRKSSCQNALFWHRHLKENDLKSEKVYIYPYIPAKRPENSELLPSMYNEKFLLQYLQTFKQKQVVAQRRKSIDSLIGYKETIDSKEIIESILDKAIADTQNYTIVKFQIFSSFGIPRINLIKNMYKELLFFGIYDYYLQNRMFRELFVNFNISNAITKPKKSILSQFRQTSGKQKQQDIQNCKDTLVPLQRVQSSPMKQTIRNSNKSFMLLCNDEFVNRIYLSFIDVFHSLEYQMPIRSSPCVFLYKTQKKVLIQQKTPSLLCFIRLFAESINKHSKQDEKYSLRLIVYGVHKQTNQTHFWGIQSEKYNKQEKKCKYATLFDEIAIEMQKQGHQFSKMGVFFCDTLHDIDSLRQSFFLKDQQPAKNVPNRQWETFNRTDKLNIQFQWMKKFEEGRSFCQNQFLFKRSLLMHYEVSDFQFLCFTYNFRQKDNLALEHHLQEMETWFAQKHRLFTFITKLKKMQSQQEPNQYEIPPYPTQKQIGSSKRIYSFQKKNMGRQQNESYQTEINMTKLLKSIAFQQIPFKNFMKCRGAIEKMYKILATHTVPYSNYPQYKGKQKSKLVKIAKEYLSIIRNYFGVEKAIRKESSLNTEAKQLQKKKQS